MSSIEAREIRPIYRDRVRQALESHARRGVLVPTTDCEIVQAAEDGITLSALVDPISSVVREAEYGGTPSIFQRGLLQALCGILENKPMQECSDHAVMRLEFALRDHAAQRPVAGIVQPENADPAFALLNRLVRALAAAFCERTGSASTANRFVPPAPDSWRKLPDAARAAALQAMIDRHPAGGGVRVHQVEGGRRAVVSFEVELDSAGKQGRLAQLEAWLKDEIEDSLQLLLEPRKDQNSARKKEVAAE